MKLEWKEIRWKIEKFYDLFRYDIPRFVKNLYNFRKTLWNSRNYDYSGSLYALRDHFSMLEPCIRNGNHLNCEKTADRIKVCINLLDRILENTEQYHFDRLEIETDEQNYMVFKHFPLYSEAPRESKFTREILKGKEEQDFELLFKLISKHLRSFWD